MAPDVELRILRTFSSRWLPAVDGDVRVYSCALPDFSDTVTFNDGRCDLRASSAEIFCLKQLHGRTVSSALAEVRALDF